MHNFHLSVGIFMILIFSQFLGPRSWKIGHFFNFCHFPTLQVRKSAKNQNHENSSIQMKIMPKILLQTNFWPQWTIF